MKLDVSIGQTVLVVPMGNAARRTKTPVRGTVISVGRKYFTVVFPGGVGGEEKFNIADGRQVTNYTADWKVYTTESEYLAEVEGIELRAKIHRLVSDGKCRTLPVESLRSIATLLEGGVQ